MPSSELSRIHLRCWTRQASRLESLLLGMPKTCVKAVDGRSISLVKPCELSSLYTDVVEYLTSQVFFMHRLYSAVEQFLSTNKQPLGPIFNLLAVDLCTLSTVPTNTNKLYKGFSL